MKIKENENGTVTLMAEDGKRLLHVPSGRYLSEAEITKEQVQQFVEV